MFIKGIYYRNPAVYHLITRLKLGRAHDVRYNIALEYIKLGDCVLEMCGADGELKDYLPDECGYECVECGAGFVTRLKKKGIKFYNINLHYGISKNSLKADVVVMINSLYQFKETSMNELPMAFKKIAGRIVIVEDVLGNGWSENSVMQRVINYLHRTDYHTQGSLLSPEEFQTLMHIHGYGFKMHDDRYAVGYFGYL